MKIRLGFMLAIAGLLPGAAFIANADPVTDACTVSTSGFTVPTIMEASGSCDADGSFDLSARWSSPGAGSVPFPGRAEAVATFTETLNLTGLDEVVVRVSIRYDEARASSESWLGQRYGRGEARFILPMCDGCLETSGSLSRTVVEAHEGADELPPGVESYAFHARPPLGQTFNGTVQLGIDIAVIADGTVSGGFTETALRGAITSISIEPLAPQQSSCRTATEERSTGIGEDGGLLGDGSVHATCDATDGTFETAVRVSNLTWYRTAASTIRFDVVRHLPEPAEFAVFTIDYNISRADLSTGPAASPATPLSGGSGVASISASVSGQIRSTRPSKQIVGDGEATGPGTMRVLIEAVDGSMLPAGDYLVSFQIHSEATVSPYPNSSAQVDVAGSLDQVTLQGA